MGSGITSCDVDDSDIEGMAALFAVEGGADVVPLLNAAVESGKDFTVGLTVNFGDGASVYYPEVPVDVALTLTQDPSQYNRVLRGR